MKDKGYFAILLSIILLFIFASPVSASNTVYNQENIGVQLPCTTKIWHALRE